MNYYITWDITGEYLWATTPYKERISGIWKAEYETPDNKISLPNNTLEKFCWEAVNIPNSSNIYELTPQEAEECEYYATTKIFR